MKTMHKAECKRVFSRYDVSCPRCLELKAGAAPRPGWYRSVSADTSGEISAHFRSEKHLSGGCGPVCTFGEW